MPFKFAEGQIDNPNQEVKTSGVAQKSVNERTKADGNYLINPLFHLKFVKHTVYGLFWTNHITVFPPEPEFASYQKIKYLQFIRFWYHIKTVGFSFDYFFYTTTFFPHSITFRPHIFSLIFLHYHFFWIFWCFSLFRVIYTNMFWSISFWLSFSHSITLTNQCLLHLHYTFSRHFIYTNMCFTFKFICTHGFLTDFFALI